MSEAGANSSRTLEGADMARSEKERMKDVLESGPAGARCSREANDRAAVQSEWGNPARVVKGAEAKGNRREVELSGVP